MAVRQSWMNQHRHYAQDGSVCISRCGNVGSKGKRFTILRENENCLLEVTVIHSTSNLQMRLSPHVLTNQTCCSAVFLCANLREKSIIWCSYLLLWMKFCIFYICKVFCFFSHEFYIFFCWVFFPHLLICWSTSFFRTCHPKSDYFGWGIIFRKAPHTSKSDIKMKLKSFCDFIFVLKCFFSWDLCIWYF